MVVHAPVVPMTDAGARRLGASYWREVGAFSRGLVRPRATPAGIELVLAHLVPLLRFGLGETTVTERAVECRYPIRGGLLASAPAGALIVAQQVGERTQIVLAVEGFSPRLLADGRLARLRRPFYAALQVRLHDGVSRRFFRRVARGKL